MKKILSIAIVTLIFFLVGAVGTYFSIPSIFPDRAVPADSLAADSLAGLTLDAARTVEAPDSVALALAVLDSVLAGSTDSTRAELVQALPSVLALLQDSLEAVTRSRDALRSERDAARDTITALERKLAAAIIPDSDPTELSKTLAGMNERQLRPILERVSDDALAALYHTASPRDKRTLIAAMPPERAVRLVQRQIAADERPTASSEATSDSASMPQ